MIALRSWVGRIVALSMVLLGLMLFCVGGPAGASGTGSCTVTVSGQQPSRVTTGMHDVTTGSWTLACSGIHTYADEYQVFKIGPQWFFFELGPYYGSWWPGTFSVSWSGAVGYGIPLNGGSSSGEVSSLKYQNSCFLESQLYSGGGSSCISTPEQVIYTGGSYVVSSDIGSYSVSGSLLPPSCAFGSLSGFVSGVSSDGRTAYPFTLYSAGSSDQYVFIDPAQPATTARSIDGHTFYQEQVLGQVTVPSAAQAFSVTPASGDAVDFQMWCDAGGTWTNWGLASAATVYAGVVPSACTLQSASGYVGDVSDGTTIFSFLYSFLGGASKLVALDDAQPASGATRTIDGKTFYADQVDLVDSSPSSPDGLSITPVDGDTVNPHVWCDSAGSWTDWGQSSTVPGVTAPPGGVENLSPDQCGDGGAFCFVSCFSTTGMSLYNPVSWVTGLVKFTICGFRWILEPSSSKVTALTNQFGLGSNAPAIGANSASQWLGSGAYLLAAGPYTSMVSIQSAERAGGCSLLDGTGYAIGTHHFSVCTALASVSANSSTDTAWSVIKPVVAACFLVMFFLSLVAMLRKILGSNT